MKTFSLKLPDQLEAKLEEVALRKNVSKSSLVREAIAEYVVGPSLEADGSFLSLARDLAGSVSAAEDLSTNPKHLDGLGE